MLWAFNHLCSRWISVYRKSPILTYLNIFLIDFSSMQLFAYAWKIMRAKLSRLWGETFPRGLSWTEFILCKRSLFRTEISRACSNFPRYKRLQIHGESHRPLGKLSIEYPPFSHKTRKEFEKNRFGKFFKNQNFLQCDIIFCWICCRYVGRNIRWKTIPINSKKWWKLCFLSIDANDCTFFGSTNWNRNHRSFF